RLAQHEISSPSASLLSRIAAAIKVVVTPIVRFVRAGWQTILNYLTKVRNVKLGRRTVLKNLSVLPEVAGIPIPLGNSNELGEVADPETARQARAQRAGLLAEAGSA